VGALKNYEMGLHERGFCTDPDVCFDPPPNAVKYETIRAFDPKRDPWPLDYAADLERMARMDALCALTKPGALVIAAFEHPELYAELRAALLNLEGEMLDETPPHPDADEFARSTSNLPF